MSALSSATAIWFITLLSLPRLINKNIDFLGPFFLIGVLPIVFFVDVPFGILVSYLAVQMWVLFRKSPSWLFIPVIFVPYAAPLAIAAIAYRSRQINMALYTAAAISFLLVSWQLASLILIISYVWHKLFNKFSESPVLLIALFYALYLSI